MTAVNDALTVLSWFENLPEDEQPPRQFWWSDELLNKWFTNVREKRDAGSARNKPHSSYDDAEDVPMSDNAMIDRSGPGPPVVSYD